MSATAGSGTTRRAALLALATLSASRFARAAGTPVGAVQPPLPAPAIELVDTQGQRRTLAQRLAGQVTAVQLMFTGCSTVCPPQGLLFATLAARLQDQGVRLLSISIDALGDTPQRLAAWQARFGATPPNWSAALPAPPDVDRLDAFLRGPGAKPGTHGTQAFVFDAAGRLVHRTASDPSPGELAALLRATAAG